MYRETANDGGNALTAVLIAPAEHFPEQKSFREMPHENRPAGSADPW